MEPIRFVIPLPDSLELDDRYLAISGNRVVMDGGDRLIIRDLGELDATVVDIGSPTEDYYYPFPSPDGRSVAFFNVTGRQLDKVPVSGGGAVPIVGDISFFFGGTWAAGDSIIYSPDVSGGLWQVSADGGEPRRLTVPDTSTSEVGHW